MMARKKRKPLFPNHALYTYNNMYLSSSMKLILLCLVSSSLLISTAIVIYFELLILKFLENKKIPKI
jgi:hypothetical protein